MLRRSGRSLVRATLMGVAIAGGIATMVAPLAGERVSAQAASAQAAQVAQAASPTQVALPAGREIVDRYIAAIGGADVIANTESWHATGTFELPGQGITGSLDVYSARPALSLVKVSIAGLGDVQTGYDGKVAWSIEPASGPSVLTGRAHTQAADDARFDAVLHAPSFTRELTTVEQVEFDRQQAYKVKVVLASGRERFEFYSVESGLQVGTEGAQETPMGTVPTTTFLRNYQRFGPMLQATEIVQRPLGFEQVVRITGFEYDNVPPETFALPPAIQALVKR